MSIVYKINDVDISDYVINSNDVFFNGRNRDKSIIAEGFTFDVSFNLAAPTEGQSVKVFVDGTIKFVGYIDTITNNYDDDSYSIEVLHEIYKLTQYKVDYDTLHDLVSAVDFASGVEFTITEDRIVKTGHGLSEDQRIRFVNSGGTIHTGLSEDNIYYVLDYDANSFQVANSPGGSAIGINDDGTGTTKYFTSGFDEYMPDDNFGYPHVSIPRLISALLSLIGATLDDSDIDVEQYYTKTISDVSYFWTLSELKYDENMLYAIGLPVATKHTQIDSTDLIESKMTCMELLSWLTKCFGLVFELTDDSPLTYKVYYADLGTYALTDDEFYSLTTYKDKASNGYKYLRRYNVRSTYNSDSEVSLVDYDVTEVGNKEETITIPNNFLILLKDKSVGAIEGDVLDPDDHQLPASYIVKNIIAAYANDFTVKRYKTDIQLTVPAISEEYFDVQDEISIVKQEAAV